MSSTEEATVSLIDLEDNSIDAAQATPRQTLSGGSHLNIPVGGDNPSHSLSPTTSYAETTGVSRNQTSYLPGYRPGDNPNGTHPIYFIDGGQNAMDINVYQQKKNLTQGMMDLALLSANANQMRYVIEKGQKHPFFYVNVVLISVSIFIQIAVGFGLAWKSQYNINNQNEFHAAVRINNFVSIGILVITIVNVIISSFNIAEFETNSNTTNITVSDLP